MPIEIRELTIKATVAEAPVSNTPCAPDSNQPVTEPDSTTEKMIEQVIKILKQRKER